MPAEDEFSNLINELRLDSSVRELFELVPNLHFFIKDRDGRLIYCNATHRHGIFRYQDNETILGKKNYDFFPNALATAFAADDRQVIDSGKELIERVELNIASSGSLSWFCTTKIPARNVQGEIVGLIGISRRLEKADRRLSEFDLLVPAVDYIHEHRTDRIQVTTLARLCQMTETSFRREFKKLFRMTPMKFIIRLRIHEACSRLLGGSDSIGDISYQCGFEDQNYFARQFRLIMKISPTEFRARQRKGDINEPH